jgi:TM2 domain-containing membrane protein YozV
MMLLILMWALLFLEYLTLSRDKEPYFKKEFSIFKKITSEPAGAKGPAEGQ